MKYLLLGALVYFGAVRVILRFFKAGARQDEELERLMEEREL